METPARIEAGVSLPRPPRLGVYGGMNENFVLVAGRSRWQADGV